MKLRRTSEYANLRAFRLDEVDMYLLSRLEDALTLEELAELMPCAMHETASRVERLLDAGLLNQAEADEPFDEDLVPGLGLPVLDDHELADVDLELDFDDSSDPLPYPEPDVRFDELEEAAAQAALFAAEPPSTVISLFKRGPLQVEIHTLKPAQATNVTEDSNVFRRPTAPASEREDEATGASKAQ